MGYYFLFVLAYLIGYGFASLYYQPKLNRAREQAMRALEEKYRREFDNAKSKSPDSASGAPKTTDQNRL